jgi:hypothetical protein
MLMPPRLRWNIHTVALLLSISPAATKKLFGNNSSKKVFENHSTADSDARGRDKQTIWEEEMRREVEWQCDEEWRREDNRLRADQDRL